MRSRWGARSESRRSVVGWSLTKTRLRPEWLISRRTRSSAAPPPPSASSTPAAASSARQPSPCGVKTPVTVRVSAPVRISSLVARAPASRVSESTTIDLPAPVSPVSTFNPASSSTDAWARTARFFTWSSRSIAAIVERTRHGRSPRAVTTVPSPAPSPRNLGVNWRVFIRRAPALGAGVDARPSAHWRFAWTASTPASSPSSSSRRAWPPCRRCRPRHRPARRWPNLPSPSPSPTRSTPPTCRRSRRPRWRTCCPTRTCAAPGCRTGTRGSGG